MSSYHVNSNGYLSACSATKNPCPLASGGHFSEQEVDSFKAEGDPRIETSFKAAPNSYYAVAKAKYESTVKSIAEFDKKAAEAKEYAKKLYEEAGISPRDAVNAEGKSKIARDAALTRLQQIYVEAGVHPSKAYYIVEDIRKKPNNDVTPVIRRKDKFDPDLKAKTESAAHIASQDPEFIEKAAATKKLTETAATHTKIFLATSDFKRKNSNTGNGPVAKYVSHEELTNASNALKVANSWKAAGIPDDAKTVSTTVVSPEKISTDKDGNINNVWVDAGDGNIERVVSYVPDENRTYNSSGHLLTETGKKISQSTHYRNFGKSSTGTTQMILGQKNGNDFEAKGYSITSSVDSGD
jgi:hypothetical protein